MRVICRIVCVFKAERNGGWIRSSHHPFLRIRYNSTSKFFCLSSKDFWNGVIGILSRYSALSFSDKYANRIFPLAESYRDICGDTRWTIKGQFVGSVVSITLNCFSSIANMVPFNWN